MLHCRPPRMTHSASLRLSFVTPFLASHQGPDYATYRARSKANVQLYLANCRLHQAERSAINSPVSPITRAASIGSLQHWSSCITVPPTHSTSCAACWRSVPPNPSPAIACTPLHAELCHIQACSEHDIPPNLAAGRLHQAEQPRVSHHTRSIHQLPAALVQPHHCPHDAALHDVC